MTNYYVDPVNGTAGGAATSWATARDTITNLIALAPPFVGGDRLLCGPGVYRETVTLTPSGATVFNTGTVDVTNESTSVVGQGVGGGWVAGGVVAGDQLFIGNFESGNNGITNGTAVFAVPAGTGNFQAGHVGYMIEIITKGAYIIGTINTADNITLLDPHHAAGGEVWPTAGAALDFYIVSGEGPYEIASVDGAAALTLTEPWSGPTMNLAAAIAGMDYEIYRPIFLIGDVSGIETDGIGGVVRITGTDDDETQTRNDGIRINAEDYWHIRGFYITNLTAIGIEMDDCDMICIEDCVMVDNDSHSIEADNPSRTTVRRCIFLGQDESNPTIWFMDAAPVENSQSLVENVYCLGFLPYHGDQVGGVTVKNLTNGFATNYGIRSRLMQAGNATFVHDCQINYCWTVALDAGGLGMLIDYYNNLFQNVSDRALVYNGQLNSTDYLFLPMLPSLIGRVRQPMTLFAPSEWDVNRYATGLYPKNEDLFGVQNMVAQTRRSWGAIHAHAVKRSTTQVQDAFIGSLYMEDASEQQFVYPVQPSLTYTVSMWLYVEPNYTGTVPQFIVRQVGAADVVTASSGAAGVWEQISTTITTGAVADWISVGLRSNNTSAVPLYGVYWQNIQVI